VTGWPNASWNAGIEIPRPSFLPLRKSSRLIRRFEVGMPHFYFHLRSPEGLSKDEDGSHYRNLREAAQDARCTKERYMKDAKAEGRDDSECNFEITDVNGNILMRVPFHTLH
jgi:hypothetical protein